ncbi:MurR/RpiR family transcriptional regulator [Azospirillum isscasi]|uniref:MurR/RpiR family transcriptional regulator n=1 Tax=Azospirillum isscasi TaxID=3053926 RepID=A0ABU0WAP1_9PROT|nr:MurR/RpiR family transcriptional regulator [Azospirillum isscasi]MDQ2101162.1 MurR/RpiR family transcriptional regulator [Azospirillum isscasi]
MDGATPSIERRILDLHDQFTASEKKLAKVVLECQDNLAGYSATELADRAGVSKATAVRFFRRLGYESYNAARVQARDGGDGGSPLSDFLESEPARAAAGNIGAHLGQDLQNLTRTLEGMRSDTLNEAVTALAEAERIWVIGFRNSRTLAVYAHALLSQLKPDVRLAPGGALSLAEEMVDVGPRDVVLAIGFRRRLQALLDALAIAREGGARSILLTDPTAVRSAGMADIVLRCYTRSVTLFDSYVAPMSLLNHLFSRVVTTMGDPAVERMDRVERMHGRLMTFALRDEEE